MRSLCLALLLCAASCSAADLTGNWVASEPLPDGTYRRTYLNLKQEDSRITGSIRASQFYFQISGSTGGPDGFTITGTHKEGRDERHVRYERKLVGDELHVTTPKASGVAADRPGGSPRPVRRGRDARPHSASAAPSGA